jgi:hypothetical protein
VRLSAGKHQVEFRYQSTATVTGARVATAALILVLLFFTYRAFSGKMRWIAAALSITVSLFTLWAWQQSLYGGKSLQTAYAWTSDNLPPRDNLAFARPTRMSSIRSMQMPYYYYSGFATDGDRTGRPFLTKAERNRPWWQVDLGRRREIGRIRIYDRNSGFSHLPLHLLISDDGVRFRLHGQITERPRGNPWHIEIAPVTTRFVRLQSGRPGTLAYTEVEIYPPIRAAVSESLTE